jgi:hypothetical protein
MPFDPPYLAFAPGHFVLGRAGGREALLSFLTATSGVPPDASTPALVDELDDFVVPDDALRCPVSRAFHAALRRQPDFADLFDPRRPRAFRDQRRGKALLAWAAFGGGPPVHVSLAGLDDVAAMREVVAKNAAEDDPQGPARPDQRDTKRRSAIGSELRWLYRRRRMTAVRSAVQFWRPVARGFEPCPPPWEWPGDCGAAWNDYLPRREHSDDDSDPRP